MGAQDDFDVLSKFAEWAGFEGDKREEFIKGGMTARGHKPRTMWEDAPHDDGKGGGITDLWAKNEGKREVPPGRNQPRERRAAGGPWGYE